MRGIQISIVLLLAGLAGCAEDAAPEGPSAEEQSFQDLGLTATDTTGVIRGLVLDPAIVPIEGAKAVIQGLGLETLTNEDGAFAFSDLEEGTYFIEVSRLGFNTTQTSAEVVAGVDEPPIVKVQLIPDPGSIPVIEPFQFNGHIMCSAVTPAVRVAICSLSSLVGFDLGDDFITYLDVKGVPDFAQSELVWDSTQPLGAALALQNFGGSRSADGESPLMINGDAEYWAGNRVTDDTQISFRVFAGGLQETKVVEDWGLGVTLDQPFAMYNHVFYNMAPPEGWWFITDGLPPTGL